MTVPIQPISAPAETKSVFRRALPVLPVRLVEPAEPGIPNAANAPIVIASIENATRLTLAGEAGAVVTNPINKAALYSAGFAYPGHTEFLAALTGTTGRQVMMLASPRLRVVPVTVHASLHDFDRDADDGPDPCDLTHHRGCAAPHFWHCPPAPRDGGPQPACWGKRRAW